jgi:hypothetical protein
MSLLEIIASKLIQLRLDHHFSEEKIVARYHVGNEHTSLVVRPAMNDSALKFELIGAVSRDLICESPYRAAFDEFLVQWNWDSPAGYCTVSSDGEVRAVVDVLMPPKSKPTMAQFKLALEVLRVHGLGLMQKAVPLLETGSIPAYGEYVLPPSQPWYTFSRRLDLLCDLTDLVETAVGQVQIDRLTQKMPVDLAGDMADLAETDEGRAALRKFIEIKRKPEELKAAARRALQMYVAKLKARSRRALKAQK